MAVVNSQIEYYYQLRLNRGLVTENAMRACGFDIPTCFIVLLHDRYTCRSVKRGLVFSCLNVNVEHIFLIEYVYKSFLKPKGILSCIDLPKTLGIHYNNQFRHLGYHKQAYFKYRIMSYY